VKINELHPVMSMLTNNSHAQNQISGHAHFSN